LKIKNKLPCTAAEARGLDEVKRNPRPQIPDSARLHPGYALSFQFIEETFVQVP